MELIERVEALIAEINQTHKYSMSRIYGLYNEVFSLAEAPQSCASCLLRRTNRLKEWLTNQQKKVQEAKVAELKIKEEVQPQQPEVVKKKRGRKPKKQVDDL